MAAAIVFQNVISPPSAAGIALIIGGSVAYAIASAAKSSAAASSHNSTLDLEARAPHDDSAAHLLNSGQDIDDGRSDAESSSRAPGKHLTVGSASD